MTVRREVLDYGDDLWARVEPTWRRLLSDTYETSAFLSVEWMCAWLQTFGARVRPSALVWRDGDDRPVACTLLSYSREKVGPLRIRCAYINATGVSDVACEHNDVLCLPEHRTAVLDDLVRVVCEGRTDELVLTGVRHATAIRMQDRWPVTAQEGYFSEAPYVALARLRGNGTPYVECLSATARWQVRRSIRLYSTIFGAEGVVVASSGAQAAAWFEEMVTLHEARWHGKGRQGSFGHRDVRRFHRSLLTRDHPRSDDDRMVPELLKVAFGDEAIGFLYTLSYRGSVSFYQSGLKYHEDNRLKPGLVTHALAAEHYLERGAKEYDFLGGEPTPVRYKRSLSTDVRMLAWLRLPAPTLKMQTLYGLRRLARGVRERGDDHGAGHLPIPTGPRDRRQPSTRCASGKGDSQIARTDSRLAC